MNQQSPKYVSELNLPTTDRSAMWGRRELFLIALQLFVYSGRG
jgi:hypothetical protein